LTAANTTFGRAGTQTSCTSLTSKRGRAFSSSDRGAFIRREPKVRVESTERQDDECDTVAKRDRYRSVGGDRYRVERVEQPPNPAAFGHVGARRLDGA
jgi:hypothetical protein